MFLVGQEKNLELIKNWNTMPSFTIVQGNNDTGKTYFIKYLCNKYGLGYMLLNNKVDTIRKLVSTTKPNSNIVYHFKDFHLASLGAKNALLKITEEPLQGNYIAISGLKQIDTLESRARIIKMQPYTDNDLNTYIENTTDIDKNITQRLISCNFRTPSLISKYCKVEGINELLDFAGCIISDITRLSQADVDNIVSRFSRSYEAGKQDEALIFVELLCNLLEEQMLSKNYLSFNTEFNVLFKLKHLLSSNATFNRKLLLQSAFEQLLFKE